MEIQTQILVSLIPGAILSLFTAYITVKLSIRQFYSQRWWEKKWDQYSDIIDALNNAKNYDERWLASIERGKDLDAENESQLKVDSQKASEQINRAISIGAFAISPQALRSLTKMREILSQLSTKYMSFYEMIDLRVAAQEACINEITRLAKNDLRVK